MILARPWAALRTLGGVLIDPMAVARRAVARPAPWTTLAWGTAVVTALGASTIARQLDLLRRALPPIGDPVADAHQALLRKGLTQLLFADRLVPSPTVLIAGLLLVLLAEPVLLLARDRRRAIVGVAALGLAPLFVDRVGELALTWLWGSDTPLTAGEVLRLPHRFTTGAALVWLGADPPPGWVAVVEERVNLVTLWSCGIWGCGLRALDGGRMRPVHAVLPLGALLGGGLATWVLGPYVIGLVLAS